MTALELLLSRDPPAMRRAALERDELLRRIAGGEGSRSLLRLEAVAATAAVDPRTLELVLAAAARRATSPGGVGEVARGVTLPARVVQRCVDALSDAGVLLRLDAWSGAVAPAPLEPELLLRDSALLARLTDAGDPQRASPDAVGRLLENTVAVRLAGLAAESGRVRASHMRVERGPEVDVVLEHDDGRVAGVEVKAASSWGPKDFRGLRRLAELVGDRFVRGAVVYAGRDPARFWRRLYVVPAAALLDDVA